MKNGKQSVHATAMDEALPLLEALWAGGCGREEAAWSVAGPLSAMEASAMGLLHHRSRLRLEAQGGGDAFSAVLLKVLAGPGGLGDFDPSRGGLGGWVWTLMRNQLRSEARKAGAVSRRLQQFKVGVDGEPLVGDGLLKAWDRKAESARLSMAKEACRQTIDRLVEGGGLGGPGTAFLASLREGRRPTLREHSLRFNLPSSTLDRHRARAVAEVDRSARRLLSRWEESPALCPMPA
jgi:hypothetical protein